MVWSDLANRDPEVAQKVAKTLTPIVKSSSPSKEFSSLLKIIQKRQARARLASSRIFGPVKSQNGSIKYNEARKSKKPNFAFPRIFQKRWPTPPFLTCWNPKSISKGFFQHLVRGFLATVAFTASSKILKFRWLEHVLSLIGNHSVQKLHQVLEISLPNQIPLFFNFHFLEIVGKRQARAWFGATSGITIPRSLRIFQNLCIL